MYLPPAFAESRLPELQRLVREHPLGVLVTHTPDGGLEANHLPFLLDEGDGPFGTLRAHVARANALWREAGDGAAVLVVFGGAQGYISPNWYPGKPQTHRYVPTWNYEAVHAHGRLRVRDDPRFVRGLLARLTRVHEAAEPQPWKMGDAPADFLDAEIGRVVGIEIEITRLEGKRKLSQNRERRDFDGAVGALQERGQDALAEAMLRARD